MIYAICVIILTGCTSVNITKVSINDKNYIALNMQKSRIEDVLGEGTVINEEGEIKNIFYDKLGVVYKNDKALYFDIYNKEFTTYKGIKVGDASELVLSRFKTPMIGNSYIVFFKGSNEVNIEKTHDYDFSILYNFSNDKISRIIISSKI